jgi:hypothetical protein
MVSIWFFFSSFLLLFFSYLAKYVNYTSDLNQLCLGAPDYWKRIILFRLSIIADR